MAFFDDLGKKLSQAGQSAVQKTKDMTGIAKINAAITEEEKKVVNGYYQLGKQYLAAHPEDYAEEFAQIIAEIREAESKMQFYRQQIQDIKGVTRCEKCGAEVANNAAFCNTCGAPMPGPAASAEAAVAQCPGCGAPVSKTAKFCAVCGKQLVEKL